MVQQFRHILLLVLLLTTGGPAFLLKAQPALSRKIEQAYQRFEKGVNLKHASISLTVLDGKTGGVVFTANPALGLATGSTLKTLTSAAALYLLGPDYRYETTLWHTGTLENGVLKGDLLIKGSGDPSLGSVRYPESHEDQVLSHWVEAIKRAGIKKVEGSVIGDDLLFDGQRTGPRWLWQDIGSYYGTGVSSLNWRENVVDVYVNPGKQSGGALTLQNTVPNVSYLKIVNEAKTGAAGTGDQVYAYAAPYSSVVFLRGTYGMDLRKPIQIALPDAAYDAALRLQLALEKQGISVQVPAASGKMLQLSGKALPNGGELLYTHHSPKLSDLIYWFNQKSINLYGEAFLKTMSLQKGGGIDMEDAAEWMSDFWTQKLGLSKGEIKIHDGSGLSPEDRVTTMAMAKVLAVVKQEGWFGSYYKSLPLYNGMKMKSGTIGGVLGYAGYQRASEGTDLVFSLLVNNYDGTAAQMRQQMFTLLNSLK